MSSRYFSYIRAGLYVPVSPSLSVSVSYRLSVGAQDAPRVREGARERVRVRVLVVVCACQSNFEGSDSWRCGSGHDQGNHGGVRFEPGVER